MTMAFEIKNAAYESDLKSRAVNVLSYLCDRSDNKTLTCFPSLKTIAKCLHIGLTTVKRAMAELVEKGFVKKDPRFSAQKNGAQTSNLYTLAIPEIKDKEESNVSKSETVEKISEKNIQISEDKVINTTGYQAKYITFEEIFAEFQEKEVLKGNSAVQENTIPLEGLTNEISETKPSTNIPKPEPTVPEIIEPPVHCESIKIGEMKDNHSSLLEKSTTIVSKIEETLSGFLENREAITENSLVESSLPQNVLDNFEKYLYDPSIRSMSDLAYELEWEREDY